MELKDEDARDSERRGRLSTNLGTTGHGTVVSK